MGAEIMSLKMGRGVGHLMFAFFGGVLCVVPCVRGMRSSSSSEDFLATQTLRYVWKCSRGLVADQQLRAPCVESTLHH
ncbi:hypothetical protein FB567DRAFT_133099 [Paraphoma chrysanthemicola]|uniref:Uncharacterized protein n=1 Tax=Paraphoma chrysanthemicola TaxID=798071 RepID=A0A8K0R0Q0_9PLEO|nr:hypothetical protein FB567DRAFT_133099 [Paraphoma chrysanthemicola]